MHNASIPPASSTPLPLSSSAPQVHAKSLPLLTTSKPLVAFLSYIFYLQLNFILRPNGIMIEDFIWNYMLIKI
jgi:hypothetical protein